MSAYKSTDKAEKAQFEGFQKSNEQVLHKELYSLDLQIIDFQRKLSTSNMMQNIAIIELATARSFIAKAINHLSN